MQQELKSSKDDKHGKTTRLLLLCALWIASRSQDSKTSYPDASVGDADADTDYGVEISVE